MSSGKRSLADPLAKIKEEVGSGVSELYSRYDCDYCQEDIPGLRVRCAECPDFDLCLSCFSAGAANGKHRNSHPYLFMNNGGFRVFPTESRAPPPPPGAPSSGTRGRGRKASQGLSTGGLSSRVLLPAPGDSWNAREEVRLLDAVEQFGYGNWKDISGHIETKSPAAAEKQYNSHYIHGVVGKHTWKEDLRGNAVDHTLESDRGPLGPSLSAQLPPLLISSEEALLLGYMPHRDDYEDFDKETEALVSQIADKSVEDENLDIALKLAQCDIYERKLREQVRRKRVARDYQLVSKFFAHNPIVQIGSKVNSFKINNQIRAVKRLADSGPQAELYESFKSLSQFLTCQELTTLLDNICSEKELKVRIKELFKYRENGLSKIEELVPFEKLRFKREFRLRRITNKNKPVIKSGPRLLPIPKDYSLRAILNPHSSLTENMKNGSRRPLEGGTPNGIGELRKRKQGNQSGRGGRRKRGGGYSYNRDAYSRSQIEGTPQTLITKKAAAAITATSRIGENSLTLKRLELNCFDSRYQAVLMNTTGFESNYPLSSS
ncbi:Uncharacterized protein FKW44_010426 [Caligus rogercresseyi]|uniref:Transcriptional adapter n=1 Tax=Caligus rogercresseyi TaxID=217165 RepID=A0A7T8K856_CALRO|nr:Uncharacterized protein FKW44_010426 [Caligus rogercresseyi]